MGLAKARIVQSGLAAIGDEIWLDDFRLPGVRSYRVEGDFGDVRRLVVTINVEQVEMVVEEQEVETGVRP